MDENNTTGNNSASSSTGENDSTSDLLNDGPTAANAKTNDLLNERRKQQHRKCHNSNNFFEKLQEKIHRELHVCENGTELETLERILRANLYMQNVDREIVSDLYGVLQQQWPSNKIHLNGSSVLGVPFLENEIDIFIEADGEHSPDMFQELQRCLEGSEHFRVIKCTNDTFLKCMHTKTSIECNLNVTNAVGAANIRLINQIISLDKRIHSVIILIKYWMKAANLIGTNFISGSTLLWLIIFYLQQNDNAIMSPIEKFQKSESQTPNDAPDDIMSVADLLQCFFEFYDRFDFESEVLCPLTGATLPRSDFDAENASEFRFNDYISIQNPFDTEQLITIKIPPNCYRRFRTAISNSKLIAQNINIGRHQDKKLFIILFGVASSESAKNRIPLKRETDKITDLVSQLKIRDNTNNTKIHHGGRFLKAQLNENDIQLVKTFYRKTQPNKVFHKDIQLRQSWAQLSIEGIVQLLNKICGLNMQTPKLLPHFLPENTDYSKVYEINGMYDILVNRRQQKILKTCLDFHKEITRTEEIIAFISNGSISVKRQEKRYSKPIRAFCHIFADAANFENVSIVFYNTGSANTCNPIRDFFSKLKVCFTQLLSAYLPFIVRKGRQLGLNVQDWDKFRDILPQPKNRIPKPNKQHIVNSIQVQATECDLEIVQKLTSENAETTKIWTEQCIKHITAILKSECGLIIQDSWNVSDHTNEEESFYRMYDIKETYDKIFAKNKRRQLNDNVVNEIMWPRLSKKLMQTLCACVRISTETTSIVNIDFHYIITNGDVNPIDHIITILRERMHEFISAYFTNSIQNVDEVDGKRTAKKSQNGQVNAAIECRIGILPSQGTLEISKRLLDNLPTKNDADDTELALKQFWAESTIKFTIKIMREILRFRLKPKPIDGETDFRFSKYFDVTGLHDVIFGRSQSETAEERLLEQEIEWSKNVANKLRKPFTAMLHIWTNADNFEYVYIDFCNLNRNLFNDFMQNQLQDYILAYFHKCVNDNQMVTDTQDQKCVDMNS